MRPLTGAVSGPLSSAPHDHEVALRCDYMPCKRVAGRRGLGIQENAPSLPAPHSPVVYFFTVLLWYAAMRESGSPKRSWRRKRKPTLLCVDVALCSHLRLLFLSGQQVWASTICKIANFAINPLPTRFRGKVPIFSCQRLIATLLASFWQDASS